MPRAAQEGPRPGIQPLEYAELIDNDRTRKYGLSPILDPREIPVHPKVFESPRFYTPEFQTEVWQAVPESIVDDIAAIQAVVGVPVPVFVSRWGIAEAKRSSRLREVQPYLGFDLYANPKKRELWVEPTRGRGVADAINLVLSDQNHRETSKYTGNISSMDPLKLKEYSRPESKTSDGGWISWYSHNVGMASLPLFLIFRNYAIMHNNLALQKLGVA